ncbi:MAG: magnesium transporter [Candidatus Aenigmarchaeota archaeon]|nr:magnesium transporter [Candidatus Aenigmarchaeota archaeon]
MNSLRSFLSAEALAYVKLRYSIFSLVISGITSIFAGVLLSKSEALILAVPGLLVLLPAALDIRGCIFGTLASRLGSAFHIGTLKNFDLKNKVLRINVFASLSLSVILSVYLGIISKILTYLFGLPAIPLQELVSISLIAGLLSGVLLTIASIWISFLAYKRSWDPDNVTSPLVTAIGDFFTIPSLIAAAMIVQYIGHYSEMIFYASVMLSLLSMFHVLISSGVVPNSINFKRIMTESMPVLALSGLLSAASGVVLEAYVHSIIAIPIILMFIPSFLETAGNITTILSSRVGSKLHLGLIKPDFKMKGEKLQEILNSMRLAYFIFPLLGIMAYYIGAFAGVNGLTLWDIVILSVSSGIILHLFLILMSMAISIISFNHNVDPDNVTIPIMTSVADIVSVLVIVGMVHVLGFV